MPKYTSAREETPIRPSAGNKTPRLPETIQVGPYRVRVLRDHDAIDAAKLFGEFNPSRMRITLAPDLVPSKVRDTLFHETLHAVWHVVGRAQTEMTEETFVTTFAPSLLDTLRRNPALVAFLTVADGDIDEED